VRKSFIVKWLAFSVITVLITSCGTSGTSINENSYVAGDGVVTEIKSGDRKMGPRISGMSISGSAVNMKPGRVALVNVWASWCSPCRAEAPTLVALSEQYPDVQFIGILTRDNLVNAEAFVRAKNITYPTLIDDALLIGFKGSLPANAIPSTIVIDSQGYVAARVSGIVTIGSLSTLIERVQSS